MSRWIELEPLIADLDKGLWGKDYDKALAEAIIQDAPSIDIVRCKECVHWRKKYGDSACMLLDAWIDADDFCSRGEREGER